MSHELAFQPHKLFQFTHPGGVRPRVQACVNTTQLMFQFTHPGGVRLDKSPLMLLLCRVSIHAPGRGATAKRVLATAEEDVSIHAPGRGATYKFKGAPVSDLKFQFTHPGGVRPRPRSHERRPSLRFNSRTREGCDQYYKIDPAYFAEFQFTHPGGVRLQSKPRDTSVTAFQFTHPGGVRPLTENCTLSYSAFQFTHPGGVRPP